MSEYFFFYSEYARVDPEELETLFRNQEWPEGTEVLQAHFDRGINPFYPFKDEQETDDD